MPLAVPGRCRTSTMPATRTCAIGRMRGQAARPARCPTRPAGCAGTASDGPAATSRPCDNRPPLPPAAPAAAAARRFVVVGRVVEQRHAAAAFFPRPGPATAPRGDRSPARQTRRPRPAATTTARLSRVRRTKSSQPRNGLVGHGPVRSPGHATSRQPADHSAGPAAARGSSSVQSQSLEFTSTGRTSTPCSRALRTSWAGA